MKVAWKTLIPITGIAVAKEKAWIRRMKVIMDDKWERTEMFNNSEPYYKG